MRLVSGFAIARVAIARLLRIRMIPPEGRTRQKWQRKSLGFSSHVRVLHSVTIRAFTNRVAAMPLSPRVALKGRWMNRFLHRIVLGVLLVATLVLFWHLLGG